MVLQKIVGICGHFGGNEVFLDGQTIKTKNITSGLKKIYGDEQVITLDTYGGKKHILKCLFGLIGLMKTCKNVIILPAQNSVKIFPLYMVFLNSYFRINIHYIVIGGWLPSLVEKHHYLSIILKKLDSILVETQTMKDKLEKQGFNNVFILNNFKNFSQTVDAISTDKSRDSCPYRLCTFSRITKLKGFSHIVNAIKEINSKAQEVVFLLDIYGQIEKNYENEFFSLIVDCKEIQYMGVVESEKSVAILKNYFVLVFPTLFYTEGIPGTIIDAYAAGLPVISSRWESFSDVIDESETGLGYEFGSYDGLVDLLNKVATAPDIIIEMRSKCLQKAMQYMPEEAIKPLIERLEICGHIKQK